MRLKLKVLGALKLALTQPSHKLKLVPPVTEVEIIGNARLVSTGSVKVAVSVDVSAGRGVLPFCTKLEESVSSTT